MRGGLKPAGCDGRRDTSDVPDPLRLVAQHKRPEADDLPVSERLVPQGHELMATLETDLPVALPEGADALPDLSDHPSAENAQRWTESSRSGPGASWSTSFLVRLGIPPRIVFRWAECVQK